MCITICEIEIETKFDILPLVESIFDFIICKFFVGSRGVSFKYDIHKVILGF